MGNMFEPGKQVTETTIDPNVEKYGKQVLDALMMAGGAGPMAYNYRGPSVAAMNEAQRGVMDATAGASNAFGIPAVSAAQGLPTPNWNNDGGLGLTGYNVFPMVEQGMSPEYQAMYDQLFGANGLLGGVQPQQQGGFGGGGTLQDLIRTIDGGRRVVFPGDNEGAGGR